MFNYVVSAIIVVVLYCWIMSLKLLWLNYVVDIEVEYDLMIDFWVSGVLNDFKLYNQNIKNTFHSDYTIKTEIK